VQPRCLEEEPAMQDFGDGHLAACHFPLQIPVDLAATRDSASG
jgi:peptide/nickel transport system ATP-binding protein